MDVNGLLSSMLLTHLAARPAFMGNVLPGSDGTNIDISHCVAPPDMLPGLAGYEFDDYHGKREHATTAVELPEYGKAKSLRAFHLTSGVCISWSDRSLEPTIKAAVETASPFTCRTAAGFWMKSLTDITHSYAEM